jgi:hypothetical protein
MSSGEGATSNVATSRGKEGMKCQASPPMDHIKRLLEEVCPNHSDPIRHKLKFYGMMRNFMTSGSLTWGAKLDEGPNGSDTTPFWGKCYPDSLWRTPPLGRCCVSSLSPRAPTQYTWGHGCSGV